MRVRLPLGALCRVSLLDPVAALCYGLSMDTIIVEIHAAEGGADARLLVSDQLDIYTRYCIRRGL